MRVCMVVKQRCRCLLSRVFSTVCFCFAAYLADDGGLWRPIMDNVRCPVLEVDALVPLCRSHPKSFIRAQDVPEYKLGLGVGMDMEGLGWSWRSWGRGRE